MMPTGGSMEEAKAVAFRAAESAVEAVARAVDAQREAVELHRRAADLHGRAAEFYAGHAQFDRLMGKDELAAELERRAEHERGLEADELLRAEMTASRKSKQNHTQAPARMEAGSGNGDLPRG
jgi:hypothetical protein